MLMVKRSMMSLLSTSVESCMEWSEVSEEGAMVPVAGSMVLQVASPWLCPNLFDLHAGDSLVLVVIAAGGQGRHLVNGLQKVAMVWGASFLVATVFIILVFDVLSNLGEDGVVLNSISSNVAR